MKIKDAKAMFRNWGDPLSEGYDNLIERKKKENPEEGVPNDNYCHALFFTDYMFRATQKHLRILSGAEGDGFLNVLGKSFEGALKRISDNHGFAHLILVDSKLSNFLSPMLNRYPVLKITPATLKDDQNVPHTIICDNHMLREEDIHDELTDESDVNQVTAKVYFNSNVKAKLAAESFDNTWGYLNKETDD